MAMVSIGGALAVFEQRYRNECKGTNTKPSPSVMRVLEGGTGDVTSRTLSLVGTTISKHQLTCVIRALSGDGYFREVDLEDVHLDDTAMVALTAALHRNTTLRTLNLSCNNINEAGCLALNQLIKINTPIQSLNISWNALGALEQGMNHISQALISNDHLENLTAANCQIGHGCAQAIANALMTNSALKVLDLRWNNLGLQGGKVLLKALEFNSTLQHLKLDGNHIPDSLLVAIEARTSSNRQSASSRAAEQARAELMQRELTSLNQRAQKQISGLQRQNEALSSDATHSKSLADALKETLCDTTTKAETLETRLELSAKELVMRDKEMKQMNDSLLRAREELVQVKHHTSVEVAKLQANCENLSRTNRNLQDETQQIKHEAQLAKQQSIADVEILKFDLQRAKDELSAAKREAATDADAAENRLQSNKKIAQERLQGEQDRAEAELRALQERLRNTQIQLEQARNDSLASQQELRSALESAAQVATSQMQSEHKREIDEWQRRLNAMEAERTIHITSITNQKEQLKYLEAKNEDLSLSLERAKTQMVDSDRANELAKGRLIGEMDALRAKIEVMQARIDEQSQADRARIDDLTKLRTTLDITKSSHDEEVKRLQTQLTSKDNKIRRLQQACEAQAEAALTMRQAEARRVEGLEAALQTCVANANTNES